MQTLQLTSQALRGDSFFKGTVSQMDLQWEAENRTLEMALDAGHAEMEDFEEEDCDFDENESPRMVSYCACGRRYAERDGNAICGNCNVTLRESWASEAEASDVLAEVMV